MTTETQVFLCGDCMTELGHAKKAYTKKFVPLTETDPALKIRIRASMAAHPCDTPATVHEMLILRAVCTGQCGGKCFAHYYE